MYVICILSRSDISLSVIAPVFDITTVCYQFLDASALKSDQNEIEVTKNNKSNFIETSTHISGRFLNNFSCAVRRFYQNMLPKAPNNAERRNINVGESNGKGHRAWFEEYSVLDDIKCEFLPSLLTNTCVKEMTEYKQSTNTSKLTSRLLKKASLYLHTIICCSSSSNVLQEQPLKA